MSCELKDEKSEESRICQEEWLCPSAVPNYNRDFYYNIWDGVFRVDRLKSVWLQSEYKTTPATLFYRKMSPNSKWVTVLWSQRVLIGRRSSNGSESDPNDDDGRHSQNHFWKHLFSRTCSLQHDLCMFMLYVQLTLSMLTSPDGADPTADCCFLCVSPSGSVLALSVSAGVTGWHDEQQNITSCSRCLRVVLLLLLRSAAGCCFKPAPWRNQTRH